MSDRATSWYPGMPADLGDRVILATAFELGERAPDALGTVIERDPYPDRDVMVRVFHDDKVARWHRRDSLRTLGWRMNPDALAADLRMLGFATVDVVANDGDGHRRDAA